MLTMTVTAAASHSGSRTKRATRSRTMAIQPRISSSWREIPFGSHRLVSTRPYADHDIDGPWGQKHARREPGDGRFLEHRTETVGDGFDDGRIAGCAKPL